MCLGSVTTESNVGSEGSWAPWELACKCTNFLTFIFFWFLHFEVRIFFAYLFAFMSFQKWIYASRNWDYPWGAFGGRASCCIGWGWCGFSLYLGLRMVIEDRTAIITFIWVSLEFLSMSSFSFLILFTDINIGVFKPLKLPILLLCHYCIFYPLCHVFKIFCLK